MPTRCNDPINLKDPSGQCSLDSSCEGEFGEVIEGLEADLRQDEDGVADAAIYEGREVYVIDPKKVQFEDIFNIGIALQKYARTASRASEYGKAIERARISGKYEEFSINNLTIRTSLYDKIYNTAGRIFGDFRINIDGAIRVNVDGRYHVRGIARTSCKENYNFRKDQAGLFTDFAVGIAGSRFNVPGPNRPDIKQGPGPIFPENISRYREAIIDTYTNQNYSFRAWGMVD